MIRDRRSPYLVCGVLVAALLGSEPASAQKVSDAAAQALFEEGRVLMVENRSVEACSKFAESLRLDPALGTRLNLALCNEKEGRIATAYLNYTDAIAQAAREGDQDRRALAQQRRLSLEPRLIRLSIRMSGPLPGGLWFTLDGTRLPTATLGISLPLDAGQHVVRYGAPGKRSREASITATENELRPELTLGELEALSRSTARVPVETARRSNIRPLAVGALIGTGIASLAVGSYSGIQAGIQWSRRNDHCRGRCDEHANSFAQSARRLAVLSDLSFAVGLAASGAGVYLLMTGQHKTRPRILATALPRLGGGLVAVEGSL